MATYKVIRYFTDLQDNNHAYNVGDTYPRKDLKPTAERIAELSGSGNKQGKPLIEAVEEKKAEDKKAADKKADKKAE